MKTFMGKRQLILVAMVIWETPASYTTMWGIPL
jgi:hypothetical protein